MPHFIETQKFSELVEQIVKGVTEGVKGLPDHRSVVAQALAEAGILPDVCREDFANADAA
ncbi:hypothetical protein BMG03_10050 [Thioclava nitratireducens]|uniref:Uncharacterized protein n=1 Tax=Thioclava nitratireducens TaxID=1915078 RepID=A0ABM6IH24_9RHOB|nr:hypothetical protein [Thioclava nitratireducens]AQS48105.1 hypothetical protein BMG03_10050 [Thioclava nitratireducens]